MTDVVITAAKRTPVGSFLGSFVATPAHELGRVAISAALEQAGVDPADVSEVILGQVLTAGQGQNPARQASMAAGIPKEVPAWGVNQVCGSGLRAVALAAQAIQTGDAIVVVAGGQENMSLSAHAQQLRGGTKMGPVELVDTMIKDGLTDVFNNYHMGITAENLAEQYQVTRGEQDAFAAASQNKASAARAAGNDDHCIAGLDRLRRERDGAQARPADLVDAPGRDLLGNAGRHRSLTRGILALSGGQHLAEDDLRHVGRVDAGLLERGGDRDAAELVRRRGHERAEEGTNRGALGGSDDDVGHGGESPRVQGWSAI